MAYTFNGVDKIISFDVSTISLDIQDLYSRWVDWLFISDNSKYLQAMRCVGGDELPGSKQLGLTYFLLNDWKIKPYEESHTLTVDGNLYSEDGSSPYQEVTGSYKVMVINQVSNLVDSTVQQLPEIEYASFNGCVTIDAVNGTDSVNYPSGTTAHPCKTLMNVSLISQERGIKKIYVIGDITYVGIPPGVLIGYEFVGNSKRDCIMTVSNVQFINCRFVGCTLTGTFANGSFISIYNSNIRDLLNVSIQAYACKLSGTIELNNTEDSNFYNCIDGVPGSGTPIIEVNDCHALGLWGHVGGIALTNITTMGASISVNLSPGRLIVDSSDTQGSIIVRGVGSLSGTTGGTTITSTDLINNTTITAGGSPTVEQIRSEIDSNSTELAAIKSKTNMIPGLY